MSSANTGAVNYINGGAGEDTIGLGTVHSGTSPRCSSLHSAIPTSRLLTLLVQTLTTLTPPITSRSLQLTASAQSLNVGDFTTNTGGVVTFVAVGNGLTARATMIDRNLMQVRALFSPTTLAPTSCSPRQVPKPVASLVTLLFSSTVPLPLVLVIQVASLASTTLPLPSCLLDLRISFLQSPPFGEAFFCLLIILYIVIFSFPFSLVAFDSTF